MADPSLSSFIYLSYWSRLQLQDSLNRRPPLRAVVSVVLMRCVRSGGRGWHCAGLPYVRASWRRDLRSRRNEARSYSRNTRSGTD